jgi:hypothetical protein
MKYNLIFENIPEVIPNTDMKEDTQQILKDFLQSELEIENVLITEFLHGWDQYSPSFANFLRVLLINFEWFMY